MAVMEINMIVEVQLISNRKYNNSHIINDEGRRAIIIILSVSILQCKEMKSQFFVKNDITI
jgi:hypothetical protein